MEVSQNPTGLNDDAARVTSDQRSFAEALACNASTMLPHLDWDEVAVHLMLGWRTSSVSRRVDWRDVEPIACEAWPAAVEPRRSAQAT